MFQATLRAFAVNSAFPLHAMISCPQLGAVLARLDRVEADYPAQLIAEVARLPRVLWRGAAAGALARFRTAANTPHIDFFLASVLVLAPFNGGLSTGVRGRFPGTPLQQAQVAGHQLSRIYQRRGRGGDRNIPKREAAAGGKAGLDRLRADLAFGRELVDLWIRTPVGDDREAPEAGKDLTPEDRELLAEPDPFGREANALMGRLMILLGFYPPHRVNVGGGERRVSPNFAGASARLSARLGKFAAAVLGDDWGGRGVGPLRLHDWFRAVLAAWRALIRAELPKLSARALNRCLR